jgi:hypothetical protein
VKPRRFLPWLLLTVGLLGTIPLAVLDVVAQQAIKPKLKVAADGFPSGHDSPEGAACDVVRSLINRDEKLFSSTCVRLYGGGAGREEYAKFLRQTIENIRQEAAKKEPSPRGPKSIGKVFAARHLTKSGPASYGYAAFDFQDVMFVDVGVYLQNGERSMMRNLVIKDRDGKWYVHPAPSTSPLLCEGLDEEKDSVLDLTDAYDLQP